MFSYHGFIEIYDIYDICDDLYFNTLSEVRHTHGEEIQKWVNEWLTDSSFPGRGSGLADMRCINGSQVVTINGCRNHENGVIAKLVDFYRTVSEKAPGSFGLLYVRDGESSDESNEYQVYVMAKGRVEKRKDFYLSPCTPTIE